MFFFGDNLIWWYSMFRHYKNIPRVYHHNPRGQVCIHIYSSIHIRIQTNNWGYRKVNNDAFFHEGYANSLMKIGIHLKVVLCAISIWIWTYSAGMLYIRKLKVYIYALEIRLASNRWTILEKLRIFANKNSQKKWKYDLLGRKIENDRVSSDFLWRFIKYFKW